MSKQYSFINHQFDFTVSIIEGNTLISELSKIHNIGEHAIDFYRKTVLSSLQLINFIKPSETLGFYIDSDEPYYRFKIEISQNGNLRTLILPEDFRDFPKKLTGKTRIVKMRVGAEPYTSILSFENHPVENIVNEVMSKSYQTSSQIITKPGSYSSLLITKLPPSNANKKIKDYDELDLEGVIKKYDNLINAALCLPQASEKDLIDLFSTEDLVFIGSKEVQFHCPCSKDRMTENIFTLSMKEREAIFEDSNSIEVRCDYCNTIYDIKKYEVIKNLQ